MLLSRHIGIGELNNPRLRKLNDELWDLWGTKPVIRAKLDRLHNAHSTLMLEILSRKKDAAFKAAEALFDSGWRMKRHGMGEVFFVERVRDGKSPSLVYYGYHLGQCVHDAGIAGEFPKGLLEKAAYYLIDLTTEETLLADEELSHRTI